MQLISNFSHAQFLQSKQHHYRSTDSCSLSSNQSIISVLLLNNKYFIVYYLSKILLNSYC